MTLSALGIFSAAGAGVVSAGAYELISTSIGTGASGVITFSSLPAGYKHLQLRGALRSDSGTYPHAFLRFNSDSGSNYTRHYLSGDGSTVASGGATSQTSSYAMEAAGSGLSANLFSGSIVDILDPFSTTKNKTVRSFTGYVNGGIFLESGLWMNTAAVTSITLTLSAGNYTTASRISLYGIK